MDALLPAFIGGLLIGISSLLMLALLGRITGISGIFGMAITTRDASAWRWAFLIGLAGAPLLLETYSGYQTPLPSDEGGLLTITAGLLVGFGTRYAGGCTSGHGVCGIGRLSPRSIAATCAFMGAGIATVFITRHLLG